MFCIFQVRGPVIGCFVVENVLKRPPDCVGKEYDWVRKDLSYFSERISVALTIVYFGPAGSLQRKSVIGPEIKQTL